MSYLPPLTGPKAVVSVKSEWLSKINWTQFIGVFAMLASFFGLDLDAKTQAEVVVAIGVVQGFLTIIWKTWFTSTVTAKSLPPGALSE